MHPTSLKPGTEDWVRPVLWKSLPPCPQPAETFPGCLEIAAVVRRPGSGLVALGCLPGGLAESFCFLERYQK